MHVRRTIQMSEAAGFAAIEIEDQLMPKRAHHHIGIEHLIPIELMVAKVKEAVAARQNPDFVVIARTNACRQTSLDDALRRGEAMRNARADMLFIVQKKPEEICAIGERLGGPLMFMGVGGMTPATLGMTNADLFKLGYKLMVDAVTPLLAMHRALRDAYAAMAKGEPDPLVGKEHRAEHGENSPHHRSRCDAGDRKAHGGALSARGDTTEGRFRSRAPNHGPGTFATKWNCDAVSLSLTYGLRFEPRLCTRGRGS